MNRFRQMITERSNLAMSMDAASRGPVHISFFGNDGVLMNAHAFLRLSPDELVKLQDDLKRKLFRICPADCVSRPPMHERASVAHDLLSGPVMAAS